MFGLQPRFRCQTSMGSCLERRPERSIHQKLFTLRYYTWQNLSRLAKSHPLGTEEVHLWTCLLLPWAQRRFPFELAFCYPERRGGSPLNLPSATLGAEEVHLWTCLLLPSAQKRFTFELAFCYPGRRRSSVFICGLSGYTWSRQWAHFVPKVWFFWW